MLLTMNGITVDVSHPSDIRRYKALGYKEMESPLPTEGGQELNATAGAIELADELGLDLAEIEGTGTGGRITKQDVEKAVNDVS